MRSPHCIGECRGQTMLEDFADMSYVKGECKRYQRGYCAVGCAGLSSAVLLPPAHILEYVSQRYDKVYIDIA